MKTSEFKSRASKTEYLIAKARAGQGVFRTKRVFSKKSKDKEANMVVLVAIIVIGILSVSLQLLFEN